MINTIDNRINYGEDWNLEGFVSRYGYSIYRNYHGTIFPVSLPMKLTVSLRGKSMVSKVTLYKVKEKESE